MTQPTKLDSNLQKNNYSQIHVHFELPSIEPKTKPVDARPYDFATDGTPTKFATSCSHCGAGNFLTLNENITLLGDKYFAGCTECSKGKVAVMPEMVDPFQNPIKDGKIPLDDLDPGNAKSPIDTTITVAEKFKKLQESTSVVTEDASDTDVDQESVEDEDHETTPENIRDVLDHDATALLDMLDQKNDEV